MKQKDERTLRDAQKRTHGLLRLFVGVPVSKFDPRTYEDTELGFVETGDARIDFLVRCVGEGRHVMLVGPRGTGKSYMTGRAVEKSLSESRYGNIAKIEIQGDPNKPPSDYFDDSISFRVVGKGNSKRVLPTSVLAPFFQYAKPKPRGGFKTGERDRIVMMQNGRPVDRLVIFWDEGNRSSPAVLNAMLSLLAEGVIRRDGRAYRFPPVSCLLTRNPDGYDAQSAKLPSPLIDRFGVQLYVYSPRIKTFVKTIAPAWLKKYKEDLVREFEGVKKALQEQWIKDSLTHITSFDHPLDRLTPMVNVKLEDPSSIQAAAMAAWELAEGKAPELKDELAANLLAAKNHCDHYYYALKRLVRAPHSGDNFENTMALLALIVLASWGDKRDPKDKPGMQYLPEQSLNILEALAERNAEMKSHLKTLGDLTRYGTSIRAFEDLLLAVVSNAVGSVPLPAADQETAEQKRLRWENEAKTFAPADVNIDSIKNELGWYLNHRCETNFNTDREPDKARKKTESLLTIANMILDDREHMLGILQGYLQQV